MGQGRSSVRREVKSNRVLDEPEQHGFKILITNYMAQIIWPVSFLNINIDQCNENLCPFNHNGRNKYSFDLVKIIILKLCFNIALL